MPSPISNFVRQAQQPLLSPQELQALLFNPWTPDAADDGDRLTVVDTGTTLPACVRGAVPASLTRA